MKNLRLGWRPADALGDAVPAARLVRAAVLFPANPHRNTSHRAMTTTALIAGAREDERLMKRMLNAIVIAGAPVAPASASASNNINRRQARAYVLDAAETNCSGNYSGMRWI